MGCNGNVDGGDTKELLVNTTYYDENDAYLSKTYCFPSNSLAYRSRIFFDFAMNFSFSKILVKSGGESICARATVWLPRVRDPKVLTNAFDSDAFGSEGLLVVADRGEDDGKLSRGAFDAMLSI